MLPHSGEQSGRKKLLLCGRFVLGETHIQAPIQGGTKMARKAPREKWPFS